MAFLFFSIFFEILSTFNSNDDLDMFDFFTGGFIIFNLSIALINF